MVRHFVLHETSAGLKLSIHRTQLPLHQPTPVSALPIRIGELIILAVDAIHISATFSTILFLAAIGLAFCYSSLGALVSTPPRHTFDFPAGAFLHFLCICFMLFFIASLSMFIPENALSRVKKLCYRNILHISTSNATLSTAEYHLPLASIRFVRCVSRNTANSIFRDDPFGWDDVYGLEIVSLGPTVTFGFVTNGRDAEAMAAQLNAWLRNWRQQHPNLGPPPHLFGFDSTELVSTKLSVDTPGVATSSELVSAPPVAFSTFYRDGNGIFHCSKHHFPGIMFGNPAYLFANFGIAFALWLQCVCYSVSHHLDTWLHSPRLQVLALGFTVLWFSFLLLFGRAYALGRITRFESDSIVCRGMYCTPFNSDTRLPMDGVNHIRIAMGTVKNDTAHRKKNRGMFLLGGERYILYLCSREGEVLYAIWDLTEGEALYLAGILRNKYPAVVQNSANSDAEANWIPQRGYLYHEL